MPSTPPKIKLSKDLRLRALTLNDASDVYNYSSDEEFCRHLDAVPPQSLAESEGFIEWILTENKEGKRCYWGVEYQGKIVGTIGLLNIDNESGEAELGFGIARQLWGTGVINTCIDAVIQYACDKLPLKQLIIGTDLDNLRAIGFAKKTGFTLLEERDEKVYFSLKLK